MWFIKVDLATASEQKRLENQKQEAIESIQSKQKYELDNLKDDLERKHREKVDRLRTEQAERHDEVCTPGGYIPYFVEVQDLTKGN